MASTTRGEELGRGGGVPADVVVVVVGGAVVVVGGAVVGTGWLVAVAVLPWREREAPAFAPRARLDAGADVAGPGAGVAEVAGVADGTEGGVVVVTVALMARTALGGNGGCPSEPPRSVDPKVQASTLPGRG